MARIRTIKPEFFSSDDICSLTPLARLFYVSLWCESDREGRLEWKPSTFKLRYFPADQIDINDLACELESKGLIIVYEVEGKQWAEIPTFTEHQVINNREAPSKILPFSSDACARVKVACTRVKAEGKEGREGKEGKGTSPNQASDEPIGSEPVEDRRKQKRLPSPEDETSARKLFGMILAVNASAKPPGSWGPWSDDIRLMREVDGRSHAEIEALFAWAKRDTFWSPNIQSPGKLREKWNTLFEQSKRPTLPARGAPPINEKFNFGHLDRSGDARAMAESMARHGITAPAADEDIEI